jgi:hypothetical protein
MHPGWYLEEPKRLKFLLISQLPLLLYKLLSRQAPCSILKRELWNYRVKTLSRSL